MIEINQVNNLNEIQNSTIRSRANNAQHGRALEFIAKCDGRESAFLSFQDWSDQSLGFIYEIYVLLEFRRQGLCGALLQKAEEVAINLGCTKLQLKPYPLDRTIEMSALISLYSDKGYVGDSNNPELMEKALSRK